MSLPISAQPLSTPIPTFSDTMLLETRRSDANRSHAALDSQGDRFERSSGVSRGSRPSVVGGLGLSSETQMFCFGSITGLMGWVGGGLGFALPLAAGIQNLIPQPSTFNPSGHQNLAVGITLVVLSATGVLPGAGCVAGMLLGLAASSVVFMSCRER